MTETQFLALVDRWLNQIEDAVEATDLDIDSSRTGKVLTLDLPDRSQMVINAQPAVLELWLASRLGAYHFKWTGSIWSDTRTGQSFEQIFSRDFQEITGQAVRLAS